MRHLEAQPVTKDPVKGQAARKRSLSGLYASLMALLLIGAAGYGMTSWWSPLPIDHITDSEKTELVTQFTRLRSIEIKQLSNQNLDMTLDSMHLDPSARRAIKQTLETPPVSTGATTLAQIVLWDFAAQDGDVVHIASAGYEIDVPLTNEPRAVAIPVDASRTIKLSGVRDGGGGITVGIQSGAGKVSLPVISPGQVLALPVSL